MRAGFHVDRGDIRQFIADVGASALATLLADLIAPPPFVMRLSAPLAFDALEEAMGRKRSAPPPLPEPVALERQQPPQRVDEAALIAAEARELRLLTPLVDFVVRESWPTSIERHSILIDAYSRYPDMPLLEHEDGFDTPRRDGVMRVSRVGLKPREEPQ